MRQPPKNVIDNILFHQLRLPFGCRGEHIGEKCMFIPSLLLLCKHQPAASTTSDNSEERKNEKNINTRAPNMLSVFVFICRKP